MYFLSDEIDKQKRELLSARQAKEAAEHQCVTEVSTAMSLDTRFVPPSRFHLRSNTGCVADRAVLHSPPSPSPMLLPDVRNFREVLKLTTLSFRAVLKRVS